MSFGTTYSSFSEKQIFREIKESLFYIAIDYEAEFRKYEKSGANDKLYRLPDRNVITIKSERFRCPEILFKPSLIGMELPGIHEVTFKSIIESDIALRNIL
jgi:actin-related protein